MCGIAGFTRPGGKEEATASIKAMINRLGHRGPDQEGVFIDPDLALGHKRLAVVDLEGGTQPRVGDGNGDLRALTFNGEIYGYADLAARLRAQNVPLRDRSDTEVLFALLDIHGPQTAVEQIDGMFAFAYRDRAGDLWLARDRAGEKPLYFAVVDGALHFASELASLRRHARIAALDWDFTDLRAFLALQYVPCGGTGIVGVEQLPPGCLLHFSCGRARVIRYWDHPVQPHDVDADASFDGQVGRLDELLMRSVVERLIADVPVGLFLSGGLDSSLVAAYARRCTGKLRSFGVRFSDESYDESPNAQALAASLGLEHRVVQCDDADIVEAFDDVLSRLDHLLGDPSVLPTYVLCRAARREVTVALGGDGADELFLGYPNFCVRRFSPLMAGIPAGVGRMLRAILGRLPPSDQYMALPFKLRQLSYGFGKSPDVQSLYWMSGLGEEERNLLWPDPARERRLARTLTEHADGSWGEVPGDGIERLSRLFLQGYLPDAVLAKVDRASMMHALEVRAPFLARPVMEFALTLPTRFKMEGGTGKRILRALAKRHLPSAVAARSKHGFAPPLGRLFKTSLRRSLSAVVLESKSPVAAFFDRQALEGMLSSHFEGGRDNARQLWTLSVLFAVTARI